VYDVVMCLERSSRICISLCGQRNWQICFRNTLPSPLLLVRRASGQGCSLGRQPVLPPLRWRGFVAWTVCWVILSFMGSCRGLVRVSGPCVSVCRELHMASLGPNLFLFSFFFSVLLGVLCRILLSFLFGLYWCTSFCHHSDILCYLSYTQGFSDSFISLTCLVFVFLHCVFFLLPFVCVVIRSVQHSSLLLSYHRLCFLSSVLACFLLCYIIVIVIVIVSLCLSLSISRYLRSTDSTTTMC
jgi:hypothetical protein